jgi:voltage-gated potassium channel
LAAFFMSTSVWTKGEAVAEAGADAGDQRLAHAADLASDGVGGHHPRRVMREPSRRGLLDTSGRRAAVTPMARHEREDLPEHAPRRLVLRALLRGLVTSTLLVALYFTLPLTGSVDATAALFLLAGLLAFTGLVVWQVQTVARARYPGLRAIEGLATAIPLFLLLFAAAYVLIADGQGEAFTEPLSRIDALYFTVTVFATVGFGDIAPRSDLARIVTTIQMVGDLLVVGVVLRVMLGAVKAGRRRRDAASRMGAP